MNFSSCCGHQGGNVKCAKELNDLGKNMDFPGTSQIDINNWFICWDLIPPRRTFKYEAVGNVIAKAGDWPFIVTKQLGKGRVVAIAWDSNGFLPKEADQKKYAYPYWEYEQALLIKAIRRAAGREARGKYAIFWYNLLDFEPY